jgi:hypothetical protein
VLPFVSPVSGDQDTRRVQFGRAYESLVRYLVEWLGRDRKPSFVEERAEAPMFIRKRSFGGRLGVLLSPVLVVVVAAKTLPVFLEFPGAPRAFASFRGGDSKLFSFSSDEGKVASSFAYRVSRDVGCDRTLRDERL